MLVAGASVGGCVASAVGDTDGLPVGAKVALAAVLTVVAVVGVATSGVEGVSVGLVVGVGVTDPTLQVTNSP